ncbi:hypothetical protein MYX78_11740, partial [Acidobacteria bacterium AH-259-G07]|nr:hypothetical protein [Acidobacteria bacterium AH-259-G07]
MVTVPGRRTTLIVFSVLTWVCFAAQSYPDAEPAEDSGGEKMERVVRELQDYYAKGSVRARTYQLTEAELNAYLLAQLHKRDRKEVESIAVRLKDGGFITFVEVNMDELDLETDFLTASLFRALLSGRHTLELEGTLQTENGMGTYRVEQARLDGDPVLAPLVSSILSSLGQKQDPPFDPTRPFPLPYGIQSVTLQSGKLTIKTGDRIQNPESRSQ